MLAIPFRLLHLEQQLRFELEGLGLRELLAAVLVETDEGESLRLLVGVNVHALAVFHQLPLQRLGVIDGDDTGGKAKQLGKLRGTEPFCTRDDVPLP